MRMIIRGEEQLSVGNMCLQFKHLRVCGTALMSSRRASLQNSSNKTYDAPSPPTSAHRYTMTMYFGDLEAQINQARQNSEVCNIWVTC